MLRNGGISGSIFSDTYTFYYVELIYKVLNNNVADRREYRGPYFMSIFQRLQPIYIYMYNIMYIIMIYLYNNDFNRYIYIYIGVYIYIY